MSTLDDDDDDDIPQLSTHALAALQQFMSEQQEQEEMFERLKQKAEDRFEEGEKAEVEEEIVSMDLFKEDWQYHDDTSLKLAQEVMNNTRGRVACISAPTAFVKLKSLKPPNARELFLFEYDARFDVYGDRFVRYDFNHPLDFARATELAASMDFVVVDPPFLSEECATKTLSTVRFLAKEGCKVLMCTG
ncbi:N(6)-adenine-specific DNA methyltransferase 2, partial [Jimgerdemannia flammicorona]